MRGFPPNIVHGCLMTTDAGNNVKIETLTTKEEEQVHGKVPHGEKKTAYEVQKKKSKFTGNK
jgi:hypothetical protein